jgi:hypothetical protein
VLPPNEVALKPTGFLDSEPALDFPVGVGAESWAGLVATVFPEFIARDKPGACWCAVKEKSAGVVRPAAAGEDTAPRALTAHRRALRSREW